MSRVKLDNNPYEEKWNRSVKMFLESQGIESGISPEGKVKTPLTNFAPQIADLFIKNELLEESKKDAAVKQMRNLLGSKRMNSFNRFLATPLGSVLMGILGGALPLAAEVWLKIKREQKMKDAGENQV